MLLPLLLVLAAAPGQEHRGAVVILRPARPSARLLEAATRLGSELRTSGFAVREQERVRTRVLAYEAGAVMALRPRPLAAISVFEADGELAAALWRVDPATGKPTAWRVTVRDDATGDPRDARAPAVLAIRAVELLHASLTGVELDAPKMFPPPPPLAATTTAAPAPAPPAQEPPAEVAAPAAPAAPVIRGMTASAGVGLVQGMGGIGPSIAPAFRVGLGTATGLQARVGLVGFGTAARVAGTGGSATVRQDTVLVDVVRSFRAGTRVQPFAAAGLGALHVRVAGRPDPGNEARDASFLAGLAHAAGGAAVRLGARTALVLEGTALLAAPPLRVRILGVSAGTSGKPSFLAALSLLAGL